MGVDETCPRDTRDGRHDDHSRSASSELGGAILQGEMVKSAVYVPLIVGGEATGRISLQNIDHEHAFSEADVRLLTTIAGSLSVALENARLFEETRQRNAELALINDIQGGLAENLEMQAMYDLIGERIHQIFDAQTVDIGVVDHEAGQIWFPYSLERGERLIDHPIEIMGFRKIALETREPVVVNEDMERRCEEAGNPVAIAGEPSKSSMFVPLFVGSRGSGVISLHNLDREHAFSESDVRLLSTIAGSLSVALENARLFEETRQRNAELALINDVQRGLAEKLEMQAMYDLVGDRIQQIFDAQVVDIGVIDQDARLIRFPYSIERGVRFPDEPIEIMGFRRRVIETRAPVVVNEDVPARSAEEGQPTVLQGEAPMSEVFVPLIVAGRVTGVISLQNLDRESAFGEADIRLLTTIAGSLSVALENARLFEETRQRNAELALINDVQRGLAENLDAQAMYDLVGDRIQEIFDAQVVDIALLDVSSGLVQFPYVIEKGIRLDEEPIELIGHRRVAVETRQPVVINEDLVARSVEVGQPAVLSGEIPKSAVFAPLLIGDRAIGLISLQNVDREHAFGEGDVRLLMTLAGTLSVALENARLFDETRQRAAELAIVNDVGQALVEQLDLDALIDRLGDQLRDVFAADIVYVALHDEASGLIEFPYYIENGEREPDRRTILVRRGSHLADPGRPTTAAPQPFRGVRRARCGDGGNSRTILPRCADPGRGAGDRRDQRPEHQAGRPVHRERHAPRLHDRRQRRSRDPERSALPRDGSPRERDGGARRARSRGRRDARPRRGLQPYRRTSARAPRGRHERRLPRSRRRDLPPEHRRGRVDRSDHGRHDQTR